MTQQQVHGPSCPCAECREQVEDADADWREFFGLTAEAEGRYWQQQAWRLAEGARFDASDAEPEDKPKQGGDGGS